MIILSIAQQKRIGKAARRVGGYDNLVKLMSKWQYCNDNKLPWDLNKELKNISQV